MANTGDQIKNTGPVGKGDHVVQSGECVSSIAYAAGHFWETIWRHPDNAEVKSTRADPNTLLAGDRLTVPPIEPRQESCATETLHRFRKKGVPARLRLAFSDSGKPRANLRYKLTIDSKTTTGTLDKDGKLDVPIPPDARAATLWIADDPEPHVFKLGGVDPISEATGVQQRLNNLGFGCPVSGDIEEQTRSAIYEFQESAGIKPSGEFDSDTRDALLKAHGS